MARSGELRRVTKSYGDTEVIHGVDMQDRRRRVHRHRRAIGLRQVDAAAHGGGARGDHIGRDHDRRPHRQQPGAQGPRHRDGVPELCALSAHERVRQHGLRTQDARHRQGRHRGRRCSVQRAFSSWGRCSSASHASCPAGSASASRWAERSCASRRCSCSTSHCRTWTPSCACRCASRSRKCTGTSRPRAST